MPTDYHRTVEKHRRWLGRLGLLDRPWFVLGAAPAPTIPPDIELFVRVDVNNSGRTAQELGLGRADLTFRSKKKSWDEHRTLDTEALLWIHDRPTWLARMMLARRPHRYVGSLRVMRRRIREHAVVSESGVTPAEIGELGKVTNGVCAACYGLALGAPEIVLSGISLTKAGHSYDDQGRKRRQIEEDRFVLEALVRRGQVKTTEQDLHESVGLPMHETG